MITTNDPAPDSELIEYITKADKDLKIRFYCSLAWHLTVDLRGLYGEQLSLDTLKIFNEFQHRVLGRVLTILSDQPNSSDEQFIAGLLSNAKAAKLLAIMQAALAYCLNKLQGGNR